MRHIIEVEETIKMRHQIIVDVENDEEVEEAIESVDGVVHSLDEFVEEIGKKVNVYFVNEEYYAETEEVEYFDDYPEETV